MPRARTAATDRPNLLHHVSTRVRHMRLVRGWSQQVLADRAGVSRRMLGAVEGGESNVSLATLDRIAAALEVTFAELVRGPSTPAGSTSPVVTWRGKRHGSRARLLLAATAGRAVELWEWSLAPGDRYQAEPDLPGMQEFVYVTAGALVLELEHGRHRLGAGDAVAFRSDQTYAYINEEQKIVRFVKNVIE